MDTNAGPQTTDEVCPYGRRVRWHGNGAELGWGVTGALAPLFGPQPLWKHAGSMLGGEVGS
jgi:hypothetical protein